MPYKCDGINCQKRHDTLEALLRENNCYTVLAHGNGECWHVHYPDKNYAGEALVLSHDFVADLMALAEKMRQETIIPFCEANNVWFVSGMGAWHFRKRDDDGITSMEWDQYLDEGFVEDPDDPDYAEMYRPPEDYVKIREMLTTVVHGKDELFEYMDCYEEPRPAHAEGCTPQKPCEDVNNCAFCKKYPPTSWYRERNEKGGDDGEDS